MLRDPKQELYNLMRQISEDGYHAGWMAGIEQFLWSCLSTGPQHYGQTLVDEERIQRLKSLSEEANGWWVFNDEKREVEFIVMADLKNPRL